MSDFETYKQYTTHVFLSKKYMLSNNLLLLFQILQIALVVFNNKCTLINLAILCTILYTIMYFESVRSMHCHNDNFQHS